MDRQYIHSARFYDCLATTIVKAEAIHELLITELVRLRNRGGRLFCLGLGGGAANAAHAVNDFRKLCGIEAYSPTDAVSELTARANDEGLDTIFSGWLVTSRMTEKDMLLVFSVGGGTDEVSLCISKAVCMALNLGARIIGIVGRPEGYTASFGNTVLVTEIEGPLLTPVTETVQIAVLHALVSDPRLRINATKW